MTTTVNKELCQNDADCIVLKEIGEILAQHPGAIDLIFTYEEYIHLIDDLVDDDKPANCQNILQLTALAARVYTNPFFVKYAGYLSIVDVLINSTYEDSVKWEHSSDPYLVGHADALRHCGIMMLETILFITCSRDKARQLISFMRERAHRMHKNDFKELLRYGFSQ